MKAIRHLLVNQDAMWTDEPWLYYSLLSTTQR